MEGQPRWGILGTGWIARYFARDLLGEGMAVSAVGSRAQATAEAFGAEFGIPRRHGSYEALMADPEVDIVYVATPHPLHHPNALAALRAGKHVLVEKPFTINAAEARELVALAREKGLFLMEAMWTRFLPTFARLRALVAAGTLGEVRTIIADHNQYLPIERAKRLHLPELGGGALLDLGVYPISLSHMLLGVPKRIAVEATMDPLGVDEQLSIALGYDSGAQASLHCGMMAAGPNRASVVGTLARVELDPIWYNQVSFTAYSRDGAVLERYEEGVRNRGMQYQAFEVERRILAGGIESPILSHRDSIEIMETMDAIRSRIGLRYPGE